MTSPHPTTVLDEYLGRYLTPVYIAVATLAIGTLFGVLAIGTLTMADKLSLLAYLRHFISVESAAPTYHGIFRPALTSNLKLIGLLYILGVSVAGMPLVVVAIFFRGFVLGFAGAFILTTLHWQGLGITLVTIVLQNLFIVPAVVIVGGVALGFSWQLIAHKKRVGAGDDPVSGRFAAYTAMVFAMGMVVVVGTALEAFAAPFLMHLLSAWGI